MSPEKLGVNPESPESLEQKRDSILKRLLSPKELKSAKFATSEDTLALAEKLRAKIQEPEAQERFIKRELSVTKIPYFEYEAGGPQFDELDKAWEAEKKGYLADVDRLVEIEQKISESSDQAIPKAA